MSGDVGRSVEGMPGYMGYVPSWTQPLAPVGTGVTKHEPLTCRRLPSQPPKNTIADDHRAVPRPGDTLPEHESFLLQKRAFGQKSVYSTDVPKPPSNANKPYTKANPAPLSVTTLAPPLSFTHNKTVASTATEAMLTSPPQKDFYSKMLKQVQDERVAKPDNLHRFSEGVENSGKGHGGAAGVITQQPKVAQNLEKSIDAPSQDFKKVDKATMALKYSEYPAATDQLKFSGSGVAKTSYTAEFGTRGSNPRGRLGNSQFDMSTTATSNDLFQGTSKAVSDYKVPPGYMGHVPSNPRNKARIRGTDRDPLRKFAKDTLLITTSNNVPGYKGHQAHSIYNDTGFSVASNDLTTYGKASKYVAEEKVERAMNQRDHAKSHAIKGFFTAGKGDSGHVADLYYQKYRPFEGYMKCGSTSDTKWASNADRA